MALLNDEIQLYRVKAPLTSLAVHRSGANNDIFFILRDRVVGKVHIPMEDTQMFLLNLCAEIKVVVGSIANGEVVWEMTPDSFGFDVVIDSLGNLHRVDEL